MRSKTLQLVILGFVAFVTSFGAHVVAVNLPVYAKQVGAGAFVIGLLIAVYDFAELGSLPVYVYSLGYDQLRNGLIVASATTSYLLVQPVAGLLADRVEPAKVMLAGLVLSSLGVVVIPFSFVTCGLIGFSSIFCLVLARGTGHGTPVEGT
jgi:MFS family permease